MNGSVYSAGFSPDGKRVVIAADQGRAQVWEAGAGGYVFSLVGPDRDGEQLTRSQAVYWAEFSPGDTSRIATASGGNEAHIWNAADGAHQHTVKASGAAASDEWVVKHAGFSAKGKNLLTVARDIDADFDKGDCLLAVWDAKTGKQIARREFPHLDSARFSPAAPLRIVTAAGGRVQLWDVNGETETMTEDSSVALDTGQARVTGAAFSVDGKRIVTTERTEKRAQGRVWDAVTGDQVGKTLAMSGMTSVKSAEFCPSDPNEVVTASLDGRLRVWDVANGTVKRTLTRPDLSTKPAEAKRPHPEHWVNWARYSAQGDRIVAACHGGTAEIWDVSSGEHQQRIVVRPWPFEDRPERLSPTVWRHGGSAGTMSFPTSLLPTEALTFEAWFRLRSAGRTSLVLLFDNDATACAYQLMWEETCFTITHGVGRDHPRYARYRTLSGKDFAAGEWTHMAVRVGGNKLSFFLDGERQKLYHPRKDDLVESGERMVPGVDQLTGPVDSAPIVTATEFWIDRVEIGNYSNNPGVLDFADLRLWDDKSLIGWWPLNEAFGSSTHDSSGQGNDLTLAERGGWATASQ